MLLSAEIRWFWHSAPPGNLLDWFKSGAIHSCPCGGDPRSRQDLYVVDTTQNELGIKVRGQKNSLSQSNDQAPLIRDVEVKGLVAVSWGVLTSGLLAGPVEFWCKWPFRQIDLGSSTRLSVEKTRWLRKFDTANPSPEEIPLGDDEKPLDEIRRRSLPVLGCNIEMTEILLPGGDRWWSFGLEAFGDLATLEDDVRAVASVLSRRGIPELCGGLQLNYPRWINQYALPSKTAQQRKG